MLCGIPHAMAGEDLEAINASTSLVSRLLGRASHKDVKQLLIFHPPEKMDGGDHAHEATEGKNKDPAADAKARCAISMTFHRHVVQPPAVSWEGSCVYDT